jgi:hypothetical protein
MNDTTNTNPQSSPVPDPELEADVLIGRIIDGEAAEQDHEDFDRLAAAEPSLWRRLAERQCDAVRLAEAVESAVGEAARTPLPRFWLVPRRLTWPLAMSGWAALVIIGLTWGLASLVRGPESAPSPVAPAAAITPVDGYRQYVTAPFVLGELQPLVVDVEELSDGRIAVTLVRRIEEVAFLDPEGRLPINEFGELTKDIAQLRSSEAAWGEGP